MEYSFYLFTQLVNDLMLNLNDWSVPYDVSYPVVLESYKTFMKSEDVSISQYEAMIDHINNDENLYSELRDLAE